MADKSEAKSVSPASRGSLADRPAGRGLAPFEEFERLMEDFLGRSWLRPLRWEPSAWPEARVPKVDVVDGEKQILVRAEIPGVTREELDVSVSDSTVTIKGETRSEERQEKGDYYRCEIASGAFSRTVALPAEVDGDKAEAKFTDGVLELTLPKVKQARRRRVEVK